MLQRPDQEEYNSHFETYISQVPEGDYLSFLQNQLDAITALFAEMSEEKALLRYAPDKWSLKELLGHVTDTERIMSYRMLCIARGDTTSLPGFDQDIYIANTNFDELSIRDLFRDFQAVRQSTFTLLTTIAEPAWERQGISNSYPTSARALAYVIAGHAQHHLNVVHTRYLQA
ncbi:squalene--hopene cyclase [Paenibacillus ferrarius]|uniref:Squalene--hopene cyclase n=1 Tax=Paenibacillus ferrarius TaxID=1469647 RepID=A0A1V4HRW1_9BACL|nr:DinB family protein [Paenibacillus ferrarius]OPH60748.1 squalene--hopene cyclase [Paenibacillus ferrarius]